MDPRHHEQPAAEPVAGVLLSVLMWLVVVAGLGLVVVDLVHGDSRAAVGPALGTSSLALPAVARARSRRTSMSGSGR